LNQKSPFSIYNASAGSGKTFSLVRDYLILLFSTENELYFKHLLAITFTNKAVSEMKSRILDSLHSFSKMHQNEVTNHSLSRAIVEATQIPKEKFSLKAKYILESILSNYALFSVETIDHFNHRLLKTFAKDLRLSQNFEVYLDSPLLLAEAVDRLILKAGEDSDITKWLIRFAIEKTEADKSWDIAYDLNKVATMLLKEEDFACIEGLKDTPLIAFENLKNKLHGEIIEKEKAALSKAQNMLSTMNELQLDRSHFSGGYLYDFLSKVSESNFRVNLEAKWIHTLGEKKLYPSRVAGGLVDSIERITPEVCETIAYIKTTLYDILLYKNVVQNLIPLATVHLIQAEVESIKEEQNILPISEFNKIINQEIKGQPALYIYERLGERYKHFFIDEFQDTSKLQWQNLIPLIENPLVQENQDGNVNSLLLVGDPKQSIYRWRGGFPEQFIALTENENPFGGISKEVVDLEYNFRSSLEIVHFNNDFFQETAKLFENPSYQKLYSVGTNQIPVREEPGYVQIDFLPNEKKDVLDNLYTEKTIQLIKELLERGYQKECICVLVRKKEEGILISKALNEEEIGVASEETLLLENSGLVQAIIEFLRTLINPNNEEAKLNWLAFIHDYLSLSDDPHAFLDIHLKTSFVMLSKNLKKFDIQIDFQELQSFSAYEAVENFIHSFHLSEANDPFLTDFVNWVFKESQRHNNSIISLLENWDVQKEKLSLQAPSSDAITVMTIHKSKGLEFDVVIFPFAHVDLYYEKDATVWYSIEEPPFEKAPIKLKKEAANYNEQGASLYQNRRETLELDNINLLYVALTRAQNELYIIGREEKSVAVIKNYSQLLKNYLEVKSLWKENHTSYSFGKKCVSVEKNPTLVTNVSYKYNATNPTELGIQYVSQKTVAKIKEDAIFFGNLLHDVLSKIETGNEIETVFEEHNMLSQKANPDIVLKIKDSISTILNHPELKFLFNSEDIIYNERNIVTSKGIIRPDRLNIHNSQSATLIDYKTGANKEQDQLQINFYAEVLSAMGYTDIKKILVYVNDSKIVVNKS